MAQNTQCMSKCVRPFDTSYQDSIIVFPIMLCDVLHNSWRAEGEIGTASVQTDEELAHFAYMWSKTFSNDILQASSSVFELFVVLV